MVFLNGEQVLLVKTASEISLKSPYVESYFLKRLRENIRTALKKNNLNESVSLKQLRGRVVIAGGKLEKVAGILEKTFGVHSFAFAERFDALSLETISFEAVVFAKRFLKKGNSFAVRAHKVVGHDFSSRDLNVRIGAEIQREIPGLKVNLDAPQKELFIEVHPKEFFFFSSEKIGVRGLPLGVEGNVAFFFEGKKSEALAAWLLMKRGCSIFPVIKNKRAISVFKKLVPWNCFRDFSPSGEKELDNLIAGRAISALATADSGIAKKDFEMYKKFDDKFSLPVLRPLLLLPGKDVVLPDF